MIQTHLVFHKYQAAGNDFIILNEISAERLHGDKTLPELARKLCDRHFGIGADGLIVLRPSTSADFKMIYFNADGSVANCGNGERCSLHFLWKNKLLPLDRNDFLIEVKDRVKSAHLGRGGKAIRVEMGSPELEAGKIPVVTPGTPVNLQVMVAGMPVSLTAVGIGNPHAVVFVESVSNLDLTFLGSQIESLPIFPAKANVEFVQVSSMNRVKARVWERGVGETLSCGTGACAIVVAGVLQKICERRLVVDFPGGSLEVFWDELNNKIFLSGPASEVFSGKSETLIMGE